MSTSLKFDNTTESEIPQTLSNKILIDPSISTIQNVGTLTLPTTTGTLALAADYVDLTTNQSVAGVKTFTGNTQCNKTLILRGPGPGTPTYDGILTLGSTSNKGHGVMYHQTITATGVVSFATINSSGQYGAGYFEIVLVGYNSGTDGASALAQIYLTMQGTSIGINTAGGTRHTSGSGTLAYVSSGVSPGHVLPDLTYAFLSSTQVLLQITTAVNPGVYDVFVRAFFGGDGAQLSIV